MVTMRQGKGGPDFLVSRKVYDVLMKHAPPRTPLDLSYAWSPYMPDNIVVGVSERGKELVREINAEIEGQEAES